MSTKNIGPLTEESAGSYKVVPVQVKRAKPAANKNHSQAAEIMLIPLGLTGCAAQTPTKPNPTPSPAVAPEAIDYSSIAESKPLKSSVYEAYSVVSFKKDPRSEESVALIVLREKNKTNFRVAAVFHTGKIEDVNLDENNLGNKMVTLKEFTSSKQVTLPEGLTIVIKTLQGNVMRLTADINAQLSVSSSSKDDLKNWDITFLMGAPDNSSIALYGNSVASKKNVLGKTISIKIGNDDASKEKTFVEVIDEATNTQEKLKRYE